MGEKVGPERIRITAKVQKIAPYLMPEDLKKMAAMVMLEKNNDYYRGEKVGFENGRKYDESRKVTDQENERGKSANLS
jgi:hypothetical protein